MVIYSSVALLSGVTPVAAQAPATFTLQPGGRAVVQFEAFCTEFGKYFQQLFNFRTPLHRMQPAPR